MGGHLNLDGGTLNLDGGTLTLDGRTRPPASPYNLSIEYSEYNERFDLILTNYCHSRFKTRKRVH